MVRHLVLRAAARRTRRAATITSSAVVFAALLSVGALGPVPPAGATVPSTTWSTLYTAAGDLVGLSAVSCPTTSFCLAVGGADLVTSDGGATWQQVSLPEGVGEATDVACPATEACLAIAYDAKTRQSSVLVTADGGAHWQTQTLDFYPYAISCASVSTCEIVGGASLAGVADGTTDAGASWTEHVVTAGGVTSLVGVSCPTTTVCVAVGPSGSNSAILRSTDQGTSWAAETPAAPENDLGTVDCPTTTTCFAGGEIAGQADMGWLEATTDSGSYWVGQPAGAGVGMIARIACASATTCAAADGNDGHVLYTTDTGSRWNVAPGVPETGDGYDGVACPAVTDCTAVGFTQSGNIVVRGAVQSGYWLIGSDGGVFSFGSAGFHGSTGGMHLQRPVVGMTATADGDGYWLVASDGGLFAFGDAGYHGSIPGLGINPYGSGKPHSLAAPIVGMVASADGGGYFMVGSDGGVFAFGDATFAGSCPALPSRSCGHSPVVAVVPDATGKGYWVITADGGVYAFGDAEYSGGVDATSSPVVSAVATPDGGGYFLLQENGTVTGHGDAAAHPAGSPKSAGGGAAAVIAFSDSACEVFSATGLEDPYGGAPDWGGTSDLHLQGSIIAAAAY